LIKGRANGAAKGFFPKHRTKEVAFAQGRAALRGNAAEVSRWTGEKFRDLGSDLPHYAHIVWKLLSSLQPSPDELPEKTTAWAIASAKQVRL
jgi:hypothetical protein